VPDLPLLRVTLSNHPSELKFFYQDGSSWLFPEAFDEYIAPIPEAERSDLMLAYHAQLNSVDEETRIRAAKAWSKWEMTTSRLLIDADKVADAENDAFAK
jgi:proline iminopeptidase